MACLCRFLSMFTGPGSLNEWQMARELSKQLDSPWHVSLIHMCNHVLCLLLLGKILLLVYYIIMIIIITTILLSLSVLLLYYYY